jgi:hypothetical protein
MSLQENILRIVSEQEPISLVDIILVFKNKDINIIDYTVARLVRSKQLRYVEYNGQLRLALPEAS